MSSTSATTIAATTTKPHQDIHIDKRIEEVTVGLAASCAKSLYSVPSEIYSVIADYIKVMRSEVNLVDSYRRDVIGVLTKLAKFHDNKKTFKDMTSKDVLSYLDGFRKNEISDPLHKWIGTYNLYRIHLLRFFKWLYSPEVEHTRRNKPAVVDNIPRLKRKEVSIYKPTDIWIPEDDLMLVDIRMPKVGGFEFYHEIRKNDIKVKVCFITAFAISYEEISKILPPELVRRQDIIHKPIGIKELVNKINDILR